jgi:hypothetical protein
MVAIGVLLTAIIASGKLGKEKKSIALMEPRTW